MNQLVSRADSVNEEAGDSACSMYFFQDELGSPVRLTDQDGEVAESYGYDEFGQDLYGNQGLVQPFGYTGYQADRTAGTYFAQAREYLPEIGRFGARDFIKGIQSDTLSINEYLYCKDEPMQHVDLNGMFILTALAIVGAGALVGATVGAELMQLDKELKLHRANRNHFRWALY